MKRLCLALILMLSLALPALAAEALDLPKVDSDRYEVFLPDGVVLKGAPVKEDGTYVFTIDADKTDWTSLILYGGRDSLTYSLKIEAPAGYTKGVGENYYTAWGDDAAFMKELLDEYSLESSTTLNPSFILAEAQIGDGVAVKATGDVGMGFGFALKWENAAGEAYYEHIALDIRFTQELVALDAVPMVAQNSLSQASKDLPAGVTAETELGGVTFTVSDFDNLTTLPLKLKLPNGATGAMILAPGKDPVELAVNSGIATWPITRDSHPALGRQPNHLSPAQADVTVIFTAEGMGPDPAVVDFGLLTLWLLTPENVPYPYYNQQGAVPVDPNRFTVLDGNNKNLTAKVYNAAYGQAHLGKNAFNVSQGKGQVVMTVAAPDEAAAYSISATGGDFIHQNFGGVTLPDAADKKPLSGSSVTLFNEALFEKKDLDGATVYLPKGITARYGGYVRLISWYRAGENTPFLTEYVSVTRDDFAQIVPHKVKGTEAFTEPVANPVAILDEDWQLVTRYDPQNGENAWHMELHLEDERGLTKQLRQKAVIYLPYPQGFDQTSTQVKWQVRHYDDTYALKEVIDLEPTPYGLRFETDSLSPHLLTWDPGSPAPSIPQTGDEAQPLWWALLMALALAGCLVLRRKTA